MDDAKLCLLAFEDRWHFVALLCCKAQGILDTTRPDLLQRVVARKLGLSAAAFDEAMKRLAEIDLIERETLQPAKWSTRQYESDSSAERTKAYRERLKNREKRHGDVTVTPPETETETETEKEEDLRSSSPSLRKGSIPACPTDEIVNLYETALPSLPHVVAMSDKRKRLLSARWRQVVAEDGLTRDEGLEFFGNYFAKVAASKFLTGRTKPSGDRRPFRADLEWLLMPSNFMKVLEGRYE